MKREVPPPKRRPSKVAFPRTFTPLPRFQTPAEATAKLTREKRLLADEAAMEQERRRLQEVRNAFFEGMLAGNDAFFQERPPEDYWLESTARMNLFAGPPMPLDPSKRAKARGRPGYNYDRRLDPSQVIGDSFAPSGRRRRR